MELDVYSGRENPKWHIPDEADAELRGRLETLKPSLGPSPEPPGLGYRGFVFTGSLGTYRAYGGAVKAPQGLLADPRQTVERFLAETMPVGLRNLQPQVLGEIDAGGDDPV